MADPHSPIPIHGRTQAELLEALGITNGAWGDLRSWGVVYSHRQACVRYLRDAMLQLIADPEMTRRRLRGELVRLAREVEEHGPLGAQAASFDH